MNGALTIVNWWYKSFLYWCSTYVRMQNTKHATSLSLPKDTFPNFRSLFFSIFHRGWWWNVVSHSIFMYNSRGAANGLQGPTTVANRTLPTATWQFQNDVVCACGTGSEFFVFLFARRCIFYNCGLLSLFSYVLLLVLGPNMDDQPPRLRVEVVQGRNVFPSILC
jgi:hypothetical protein